MKFNKTLYISIAIICMFLDTVSAQQVYINEVMFKPGPSLTQDPCQSLLDIAHPNLGREYIELYNPDCTSDINISGWVLASKTGDTGGMGTCVGGSFCFPSGTIVPAGGFLTIGGADETCNGCSHPYLVNSIDIKLRDYYPSDYLCVCDDGQNYSGVWFLPNIEGWIALYEPDGTPHTAVYWANYENNVYSVGNEFGFNPCKPVAYTGADLKSATEMSVGSDPIMYIGPGSSVVMGNTYSRIPDAGSFQANIPPSIGPNRADRCNDGNCFSCGNIVVTPFQDTCSVGNGRLLLEVPITISSPPPYSYVITGPAGYTNSFTTSNNPHLITGLFSGTYSVTITDSQSPPATTTEQVVIGDVSDIVIAYQSGNDTCQQGIGYIELQVTGGVQPYSYTWSHTTANSPTVSGLNEGTYSVTVTGPNGVCPSTQTVTISNEGTITAELDIVHPLCNGDTNGSIHIVIHEGEAPFQYLWSDNSTDSFIENIGNGTYFVTITSADNCVHVLTGELIEPEILDVVVSNITIVCEGESNGSAVAIVTGGTPIYSYLWESGELTETATMLNGGLQSIQVTDANGCFAVDTFEITIVPIPNVDFSASPTAGCVPLQITFSNLSDAGVYVWNFGNSVTSSIANPTYTYPSVGTFSVSLTVIDSGCENTLMLANYVQVYPNPIADFVPSTTIANEEESTIYFYDQSSGAVSWQWNFYDQSDTSYIQNPIHTFSAPGEYSVCQIATNQWNCSDTICKTILIRPFISLYIPNAFTPDGDGINDYFMPSGININPDNFSMHIYDRWGNIVFYSNSFNTARWDGRYQFGSKIYEKVPQGVYIYVIKANFESYPKYFEGTVTVIY